MSAMKISFHVSILQQKGLIHVYLGVLQWLVDPVKQRRCCDSFF
jgi:hypothetical protein